jgi:LuxR family maltose regulon positive regulatory protein
MTDYIVEDLAEFCAWPERGSALAAPFVEPLPHWSARPAPPAFIPRTHLSLPVTAALPPLTIVNAPAGFGKSSLLSQWARELAVSRIPTLQIRLHPGHITAGDGAGRTMSVGDHTALTGFIRTWLDTRGRAVVTIDDAHLLPHDMAQSLVASFLLNEIDGHALVLASRRPLGLALARARTQGLVGDIDIRNLRFSPAELHSLADRALHRDIGNGARDDLLGATAGWPTAVAACLRRMAEIGVAATLKEMQRGSGLMDDFFVEEVLRPLPVQSRQFLAAVSGLGVLNADLCDDALGRDDSAARLDDLVEAGAFIEARDGCRGEYVLHPLFGQFLQAELMRSGRAGARAIAARATAWFERHDRLPEAFACATLAEAWTEAAILLERYAKRGCMSGQGQQVVAMALKLPQDVLRLHPRIAVFAARGASTDWRFGLVEDLLHLADTTAAKDGSDDIEDLVLHSRMLMSQYEDDQAAAGRKCLELLRRVDHFDHYMRGTIYGSLLYARREQFDFTDAAGLEAAGLREFTLGERPLGMVWHLAALGPTHALRGDLATAERRLEEAATVAAGLDGVDWMSAVPALLLAEIHYERNQTARSAALIDKHHAAPLVGFIDQYVASFTIGAKLRWLAGDIDGAHRWLDEGMALAEHRALERLRRSVVGERIRLLVACGQSPRALEIGRQENLMCDADDVLPGRGCTTRDEIRAVSWFRLMLARGALGPAIAAAQAWKRFTAKAGAVRSTMRWEIMLARAYLAQGHAARAQRELRSALDRAMPGGHIRSFLDEGEPIIRLLQDQVDASTIRTGPTDAFVMMLLVAASGCNDAAQTRDVLHDHGLAPGPLTKTQVEILQMANVGLQNSEIARRIGMTEGSVKWYMQQIFNKIGIRKRTGALERARAMGLLG